MSATLSIIIPVGPEEKVWKTLLWDLVSLPGPFERAEIILVGTVDAPADWNSAIRGLSVEVRWLKAEKGRAKQMNVGVQAAQGDSLWFLHADSRLTPRTIEVLFQSVRAFPEGLHFFNLVFQNDGPRLIQLNTLGVWFRSRVLRLPFGDQGFFLSKESFQKLGGFDECAEFGEDHLLVWKAKRLGVPLCCSGAWISTSARRYREHGWGRTTLKHLFLTTWQGVPEFLKWMRSRVL